MWIVTCPTPCPWGVHEPISSHAFLGMFTDTETHTHTPALTHPLTPNTHTLRAFLVLGQILQGL